MTKPKVRIAPSNEVHCCYKGRGMRVYGVRTGLRIARPAVAVLHHVPVIALFAYTCCERLQSAKRCLLQQAASAGDDSTLKGKKCRAEQSCYQTRPQTCKPRLCSISRIEPNVKGSSGLCLSLHAGKGSGWCRRLVHTRSFC